MSIRIPVKLPGASQAERSLSGLDEQTDALTKSQRTLTQTVDRTSKSLGGLADKADEAGSAAKEAGDDAEKGMSGVPSATQRAERGMDSYAQSARRAQSASAGLSRGAKSTANNLSFELTQASADAKFGLVGLANQIPLISEQFTRLQSKTGSTSGALGALFSTLKGPTGVIGAITLLLTFKDEITAFFSSFTEGAQNAKQKTEALKSATDELLKLDLGFDTQGFESIESIETALSQIRSEREEISALELLEEEVTGPEAQAVDDIGQLGSVRAALQDTELTLQELREGGVDVVRERLSLYKGQRDVLKDQEERLESLLTKAKAQKRVFDARPDNVQVEEDGDSGEEDTGNVPSSSSSGFTPRVQEAARAFADLRSQIALINLKPFLDDTGKANERVQAVVTRIRQLQDEGQLLSEEGIDGFIQDLQLSEAEAKRVRNALSEVRDEATALEEARGQIARLEEAGRAGLLPSEEVLKRKRDILRETRDTAIQAGNIDQAQAAQEQLNELPQQIEEETSGALEQGFQSGLQSGINKELQPLFDRIENDFARALISAITQAVTSEAATRLTDLLFDALEGGGSGGASGAGTASQAALGLGGASTSGAAKSSSPQQSVPTNAFGAAKPTSAAGKAGLGLGAGGGGAVIGQGVQQATDSKAAGALTGAAAAGLLAASGGAGLPLILGAAALGGLGGFFADGGRPPVGKPSVVGERGPELFVPDTAGEIVPSEDLSPPSLPPVQQDDGLKEEVRALRESTEQALNRPAKAEFTPKEFRRGQEGTQKYQRSKSPRTTRG